MLIVLNRLEALLSGKKSMCLPFTGLGSNGVLVQFMYFMCSRYKRYAVCQWAVIFLVSVSKILLESMSLGWLVILIHYPWFLLLSTMQHMCEYWERKCFMCVREREEREMLFHLIWMHRKEKLFLSVILYTFMHIRNKRYTMCLYVCIWCADLPFCNSA